MLKNLHSKLKRYIFASETNKQSIMKVLELNTELKDRVVSNIAMFKKEDGTFSNFRAASTEDEKRALNMECVLHEVEVDGVKCEAVEAHNTDVGSYILVRWADGEIFHEVGEKAVSEIMVDIDAAK